MALCTISHLGSFGAFLYSHPDPKARSGAASRPGGIFEIRKGEYFIEWLARFVGHSEYSVPCGVMFPPARGTGAGEWSFIKHVGAVRVRKRGRNGRGYGGDKVTEGRRWAQIAKAGLPVFSEGFIGQSFYGWSKARYPIPSTNLEPVLGPVLSRIFGESQW